MHKIAVLITCHNRRATTIRCLTALYGALERVPQIAVRVYLTDDGSTDGTADAVREFDREIHVIEGPGNLYWNRGMVAAWRAAIESNINHDFFLLLNDDTRLDPDAIAVLMDTARTVERETIIVGAVCDPDTGDLTYGGIRRTSTWHPGRTARIPISIEPQDADTFNANCVLVPAACVDQIGILDSVYTHAMGDYDYGLRARESGIRIVVTAGTIGTCPRRNLQGSWVDVSLPLRERIRLLNSAKGLPLPVWHEYLRRHGAPVSWLLALAPFVQVLLGSFLQRFRGFRAIVDNSE